jgi:hypothetical protein
VWQLAAAPCCMAWFAIRYCSRWCMESHVARRPDAGHVRPPVSLAQATGNILPDWLSACRVGRS